MNDIVIDRILETCKCIPIHASFHEPRVLELFPPNHQKLLCAYSSVSAYHGYYRLLPLAGLCNLVMWNEDATWKYPLSGLLDEYMIIASTGLGVQFAYSLSELRTGRETVYEINFEDFEIEKVHETFDHFIEKEFIQNSKFPYDVTITDAYRIFGDINIDELLLYNPPLLLGGEGNSRSLSKMHAIDGMRFMADIKMSFDGLNDNDYVANVATYIDSQNRMRWRIGTSTEHPQ